MTYTAIFKDGPLGGQFREIETAERVIRVPSYSRIDVSSFSSYPPYPEMVTTMEEYELAGVWYGRTAEYHWRNPAKHLRKQNERLLRENGELRLRIAAAQEALKARSC